MSILIAEECCASCSLCNMAIIHQMHLYRYFISYIVDGYYGMSVQDFDSKLDDWSKIQAAAEEITSSHNAFGPAIILNFQLLNDGPVL
jgi:hypothetical protein